MEELINRLKKNRPNLSSTSIKTYTSILGNLYKKMEGKGDIYDFLKNNIDKIVEHLAEERPNLRKTKMAVLVSLFGEDVPTGKLREIMLEDANEYNASLRTQQMNEKQKENWLSVEEIREIYKKLYKKTSPFLKKQSVSKKEYSELLELVLLSLYTLIPPRRSQDFCDMKIRGYNEETDNYYDGKQFVFHRYKTAKQYGKQTVKPTPRLRNILNKWILLNPHDYLLASFDGHKMSVSRMTLLLNKIFEKNVSTTMLRHIFIQEQLKDTPRLSERDQLAKDMAHSVDQQELYRVMNTNNMPTGSVKRSMV